nr:unnamed protein product [Callosobruchus chinensis]
MLKEFKIEPMLKDRAPHQTKAIVAMSGGVDSSVAAALLDNFMYQVIGVTLWHRRQDIYDAKRVAESVGFPHYILNYEEIFKKEVIEDLQVPICVGKLHTMRKMTSREKIRKNGEVKLCRSIDKSKDQSYFLFATTKEQLKLLRFPLGGLQISEKPDSQDICFVSESYSKTIAKLAPQSVQKGKIVDVNGKVLGEHSGIVNFTVEQRKGLGIAHNEPLYVIKVNTENSEVIVGDKLVRTTKGRYGSNCEAEIITCGSLATIHSTDEINKACVILNDDYSGISSGQACVAYKGEQVIGGGWICP